MDEVVVVGYGTVKKRDLTGSVTSVDSEKLLQSPALSAAEAIQGKVPGVLIQNTSWTPGATPSILIRGTRSIKAGNDPLYVVDGIPISTAPNLFAPGDIESIEVLKDASATAIYGSRGANGVIIISTKKGKKGKVQVDYNGYYGIQTIQNKLELMDGAEYAEYVREAIEQLDNTIQHCLIWNWIKHYPRLLVMIILGNLLQWLMMKTVIMIPAKYVPVLCGGTK